MGCGCLNNAESINALIQAKKLEKKTGKAHAIALIDGKVYLGEVEKVKSTGLPYITTDQVRHENKPKKRKAKPKKENKSEDKTEE